MTETQRPILTLDVDGVLSALPLLGKKGRIIDPLPAGWRDGEASARAPGWREPHTLLMRYDPDMGAKLMKLAGETGAELTWLTSWEQEANRAISPLVGLPSDLPVVDLAPGRRGQKFSEYRPNERVKALALRGYEPDRPVLWLDDEATAADLLVASRLPDGAVREIGLVRVNGRFGLREKDLQRARKWLLALRSGE